MSVCVCVCVWGGGELAVSKLYGGCPIVNLSCISIHVLTRALKCQTLGCAVCHMRAERR